VQQAERLEAEASAANSNAPKLNQLMSAVNAAAAMPAPAASASAAQDDESGESRRARYAEDTGAGVGGILSSDDDDE
jgi:hypothetical protein